MLLALDRLLARLVAKGDLTVIDADGKAHRYGDGTGTRIVVRLKDRKTEWLIALDPELATGEAYREGRLAIEEGSLYALLDLTTERLTGHTLPLAARALGALRSALGSWRTLNPKPRAKSNIRHHYDIDPRIYDLFLDRDRQYSCAYFNTPGAGLDEAQCAKKRHIAAKLLLAPGQHVLDIGCGWGGLALYLAATSGVEVTGITLSDNQLRIARDRASRAGLAHRVDFALLDYRALAGTYDRIVSVGMFEHVGLPHYTRFFEALARHLDDRGAALLHTIGRSDGPFPTNPFIARYIFPGGHLPSLSEILPAIERAGLIVTDIEVLRLHYAETLKAWRERFLARRAEAAAISGEEFCRMWEFYLAASETAFRYQGLAVFQIQLAKRVDALPILRDYMGAAEQRLAKMDARFEPDTERGERLAALIPVETGTLCDSATPQAQSPAPVRN